MCPIVAVAQQSPQRSAAAPKRARRPEPEVHHIWRAFKGADTGTLRDDLRNELVGAYHYLVKVIGNRIAARLPRSIDVQDLRSAGVFGLMRAIENYDIERGTPFASYCATRVRGAILDELRAQDWVPRLVRNRAGTFNEAVLRLQKRLGRDPSNHEVGQVLRMGADEIEKLRRESNLVSVFTLNQAEGDDDDPQSLRKLDALMDRGSSQPFDSMVARDLTQAMMNSLARNERTVIALYYHEGLTMKEIGRVMRISESRVCQIHTKTLKKLKEQIDAINQGEPAETPPTPPRFRAGRRPRTSVQ